MAQDDAGISRSAPPGATAEQPDSSVRDIYRQKHTFAEHFDDISSFDGNQPGEVDLGDTYRFGMGIAFALNRQLSLSLSYSQAITTEAEQTPQGGVTTGIIGSQGSAGALNLGMTLALGDSSSLIANIGVGVTGDAPDISLSFSMPFSP